MEHIPSPIYTQRDFSGGLNTFVSPQDMSPNEVQVADNVFVKGRELRTRPGKIGQFNTPLNGPLYCIKEYVKSDGSTNLLFVCGGKLYHFIKGANTYSEILIDGHSFALNSSAVRMVRSRKYMYMVDGKYSLTDLAVDAGNAKKVTSLSRPFQPADAGKLLTIVSGGSFHKGSYTITSVSGNAAILNVDAGTTGSTGGKADLEGPLYRINIDTDNIASASIVTPLQTPAVPPTAALTNIVIDPCNNIDKWETFPSLTNTANMILHPSYITVLNGSGADADYPPIGWIKGGDTVDFVYHPGDDWYLYLDGGQKPEWLDYVAPTPMYTGTWLYSDLVLQTDKTKVASVSRPFVSSDIGNQLVIIGSTNFTAGTYTIVAVSSGIAKLSAQCGTVSLSTGGCATLQTNTVRNARVFNTGTYANSYNGNNGPTFNVYLYAEDTTAPIYYTDLVVSALTTITIHNGSTYGAIKVSSSTRPFVAGDKGKTLSISSNTGGWTAGDYVIYDISSGVASLLTWGIDFSSMPTGGVAKLSINSTTDVVHESDWLGGVPPSYVNVQNVQFKNLSSTFINCNNIFSFTSLVSDFLYTRFRLWGPSSQPGGAASVGKPFFNAEDVRLNIQLSGTSTIHVAASPNISQGGNNLGGNWARRNYTAQDTIRTNISPYYDLVIQSVNSSASTSVLSSSNRPFISGDIGRFVSVFESMSGFTNGRYKILSVSDGQATVAGIVGTAAATGGIAVLLESDTPDFSLYDTIAFAYTPSISTPTVGFRFGFQAAGQAVSNVTWSSAVNIITDPGGTYLTCDISNISTAIRANCQYFYLQITNDLPNTVNLNDLFTFGPMSASGNLTIGYADYTYAVSEVQDCSITVTGEPTGNSDDGIIESDPSPTSTVITPTGSKASASIILPSPVNAATNYYYLYRYGGVFPSTDTYPTARLIAKLPVWTSTLDSDVNPYVTWDHNTRTVYDNMPDANLYLADTMTSGRGAAPFGGTSIAEWQGRICIGKGTRLYLSWLIAADQASGIYFNDINTPDDPYGDIKGMQATVGANDGDPIQNFLVYSSYLIILKQRSVFIMAGTDATNFELSGYMIDAGVGLTAPMACTLVQERPWFLGSNAMYIYAGNDQAESATDKIQDFLNPSVLGNGMAIAPSVYAKSTAIYHGRRLYLFMPAVVCQYTDLQIVVSNKVSSESRLFSSVDVGRILNVRGVNGFTTGEYTITAVDGSHVATLDRTIGTSGSSGIASLCDSYNTVAYVYDTRTQAWTRFLNMDITSAVSLSTETDTDDMFLAGTDGQVYLLSFSQYGDQATPSANPVVIDYTVRSRGFGREGQEEDYWRENKGEYILARFTTQEPCSVTLTAGAVRTDLTSHVDHSVPAMDAIFLRDKVDASVRGDAFYAEISGQSVKPTFITSLGIEIGKGAIAPTG